MEGIGAMRIKILAWVIDVYPLLICRQRDTSLWSLLAADM